MSKLKFQIKTQDQKSRTGLLKLKHGEIKSSRKLEARTDNRFQHDMI